ncbi:hypothetical protein [Phaeobacter sp.]|uniref:hypothetical protein n=1 Tax=Phaeobacter sp. TaxID=1902409 RepID=UPI0025F172BD|nr:hypothetical protein [Phaeobacter sp.]
MPPQEGSLQEGAGARDFANPPVPESPAVPARITAQDQALALQLAVAVSVHVPRDDPIHKGDLPQEIAQLLSGSDRNDADPASRLAHIAARDDLDPAGKALLGALRTAFEAGPLEDHDKLVDARNHVLGALTASDRPVSPPAAVIAWMSQRFTHSEVWAMCSTQAPWPKSLPALDTKTWIDLTSYLAAEITARSAQPETHTSQKAAEAEENNREEGQMDIRAREQAIGKLMTGTAGAETFEKLTDAFSFTELQALTNPELVLPESLPALTASDRQTIAAAIKAGPPWREDSGGGRRGGAPRFLPDPKYDGRALQLAAAITERVDFENPVHRRQDLVSDIRGLLRAADAVKTLQEDKVTALMKELTDARVMLDAKLALAHEVVADDPRGPKARILLVGNFLRDVGDRNEDGRHPLTFQHKEVKDAYDRLVSTWVAQALSQNPAPTDAERSVARIANLPNLPASTGELIEALKYVFREGSLKPVDEVVKDRDALLTEIAATTERPKEASEHMEKIYQVFTHREVVALARGDRYLPGTLPALDEQQKIAVKKGLAMITSHSSVLYNTWAWGKGAKALENGLHPGRAQSRSRGRGLGM